jgi:hypothetical protein
MKKLLFSFVLFLGLIMIGCQENSITDPNPAGSALKANTDNQSQTSGTIAIDGVLKVPGTLNTYYTVKGKVDYTTAATSSGTDAAPDRYDVAVTLAADATIRNSEAPSQGEDHIPWYISSTTKDQFYAAAAGRITVAKVFPIKGRTDGMVLVVKFNITTSSVQLDSRWLSFPVNVGDASLSTH